MIEHNLKPQMQLLPHLKLLVDRVRERERFNILRTIHSGLEI